MIAIGVAVAQFIASDVVLGVHLVTLLAVFLAVSGMGLTLLAGAQFWRSTDQINRGTYRSGVSAIVATVAVVVVAGIISIGIILFLRQPL